jgi:hypothetical protein
MAITRNTYGTTINTTNKVNKPLLSYGPRLDHIEKGFVTTGLGGKYYNNREVIRDAERRFAADNYATQLQINKQATESTRAYRQAQIDNTVAPLAGIASAAALVNSAALPVAAGLGIGYGTYKLGQALKIW